MRHFKKIFGFTLVELIVTITILTILGTIAFISLQGYAGRSRDSVRMSDIHSIEDTLGYFALAFDRYPDPTNPTSVTYSGSTVWRQGTVGDSMVTNLQKLNKKPIDPLTGKEYAYSVTASAREFQVAGVLESAGFASDSTSLIPQTYAAGANKGYAAVEGNYNGFVVNVSTGGINYLLAVPSIISSDLANTDLGIIINNQNLVYNNYSSLPASYSDIFQTKGSFTYFPSDIVVYTGSLNNLSVGQGYTGLITKLGIAFSTGSLSSVAEYQSIQISDLLAQNLGIKMVFYPDCNTLKTIGKVTASGVYDIKPLGTNSTVPVYCDMSTDGGGWTLVMKVNGANSTFSSDSAYWTNTTTYNPANYNFDGNEFKSSLFSTMPLSNIMLTFVTGGSTTHATIPKQANSLKEIFLGGQSFSTSLARSDWLGLIPGSSLQPNCNVGGFNLSWGTNVLARIGFIGNEQNDCSTPDSSIGVGLLPEGSYNASAGNNCAYSCVGGDREVNSFVYIFVR